MADVPNVDVVNIKDVTLFTSETDITAIEVYSRKGGNRTKMDGQVLANEAVNKGVHTSFTGSTIPDGATNKEALQALETAVEAAGGETNTASNLGAGAQVYSTKVGADLRFRSLLPGNSGITVTQNANDISIAANDRRTAYSSGKARIYGITGDVVYTLPSAGVGRLTLAYPYSASSATIIVAAADMNAGAFTLQVDVTNGTINSWVPSGAGSNVASQDLWIPSMSIIDGSGISLNLTSGYQTMDVSAGAGTANYSIGFGTNRVSFTFGGDFGSKSFVILNLKF